MPRHITITKEGEVNKALTRAGTALATEGFTATQILALVEFTRAMIEVVELEAMDPRLIEGDNEADVRGY